VTWRAILCIRSTAMFQTKGTLATKSYNGMDIRDTGVNHALIYGHSKLPVKDQEVEVQRAAYDGWTQGRMRGMVGPYH
jgi:hypothetical protein